MTAARHEGHCHIACGGGSCSEEPALSSAALALREARACAAWQHAKQTVWPQGISRRGARASAAVKIRLHAGHIESVCHVEDRDPAASGDAVRAGLRTGTGDASGATGGGCDGAVAGDRSTWVASRAPCSKKRPSRVAFCSGASPRGAAHRRLNSSALEPTVTGASAIFPPSSTVKKSPQRSSCAKSAGAGKNSGGKPVVRNFEGSLGLLPLHVIAL